MRSTPPRRILGLSSLRILALATVVLTSGCATGSRPLYDGVPNGSTLQLQQAFESVENGSQLQFQQGQRVQPGNLDRWQTYCLLYVYDKTRGAEHRIDLVPGNFEVNYVQTDYRSSDYPFFPNQKYFGSFSWGVRDAPAYYTYRVAMALQSSDQPEVRSLNCYRKWSTPRAHKYPTGAEIREALGDFFRLSGPQ